VNRDGDGSRRTLRRLDWRPIRRSLLRRSYYCARYDVQVLAAKPELRVVRGQGRRRVAEALKEPAEIAQDFAQEAGERTVRQRGLNDRIGKRTHANFTFAPRDLTGLLHGNYPHDAPPQ